MPGTASAKGEHHDSLPDPVSEIRAILASAVHELSQPLTVLTGTLELLQSSGSLPASAAQAVDEALLQVIRAMRITHLLLEYSGMENDDISAERISPRKLIEEMDQDLRALAETFGRAIAIEPGSGGEGQFPAVPLRRAILRLVDQALEASPPGGSVEITLSGDAARALIEIRDDGPAIPAESLRLWFDLSQRIPAIPGRGRSTLKLALVKRDVGALGGRLLASSAEGQGARISIDIPLA